MPRPRRPRRLRSSKFIPTQCDVDAARLDPDTWPDIAKTLGLPKLTVQQVNGLSYTIACYRKTENGSGGTTIGGTELALNQFIVLCEKTVREMSNIAPATGRSSANKRLRKAVTKTRDLFLDITSDDSGMPYDINEALRSHAVQCLPVLERILSEKRISHRYLVGFIGQSVSLLEAACAEARIQRDGLSQLGQGRINPIRESFRHFCGNLRIFFMRVAASDVERTRINCRRFVLAVLTAADIKAEYDFESHPDRLDEAMLTDVPLPA